MLIEYQIETLLSELTPTFLSIENESHKHNVPQNSQTHFNVIIVSPKFIGLSLIKRHQAIYALLATLMNNPIHALALHTFTEEEWQIKQSDNFNSPNCLGGSKKTS